MEPFNDADIGKNDIISSPEVTQKTASEAVENGATEPLEPLDEAVEMEKAERNARIISKQISKYIKDIDNDESGALSDGAEVVFRFMAMSSIGRFLSSFLLVSAFTIPFLPRAIRLIKRKKTENEGQEHGNV